MNENGVAIGNHTIYTRDPVPKTGLLGMDLVRLGLERARTAESAAEIIIGRNKAFNCAVSLSIPDFASNSGEENAATPKAAVAKIDPQYDS